MVVTLTVVMVVLAAAAAAALVWCYGGYDGGHDGGHDGGGAVMRVLEWRWCGMVVCGGVVNW